jgi:hypothetical protein
VQFVGRCRYNIDNLVIADVAIPSDRFDDNGYITTSRKKFHTYMMNKECVGWFEDVSHLVKHDVYGIKKFILGTEDNRFIGYMNSHWLLPKGISDKLQRNYWIWREEDKAEIVDMACDCKIFGLYKSRVTFARVIRLLQNCLGYEVDSSRAILNGEKQTYKLVVSYDSEGSSYVTPYPTVVEGF